MSLTKLFRPSVDGSTCCAQIHADHYNDSLKHILAMTWELCNDFRLQRDHGDIHVMKYGGVRIKGITFVEVFLPADTKMPEGYEEIKQTEYILGKIIPLKPQNMNKEQEAKAILVDFFRQARDGDYLSALENATQEILILNNVKCDCGKLITIPTECHICSDSSWERDEKLK